MCLIEYASKIEKNKDSKLIFDDGISDKLNNIESLLSDF